MRNDILKKKKPGRKKKHKYKPALTPYQRTLKRRAEKVKQIFDASTKDLAYVSLNEALLKEHITFIKKCRYTHTPMLDHLSVPKGQLKGRTPKPFANFAINYPYIYARWLNIIQSCLNPEYPLYKFIGAKGILMSKEFFDSKSFCIYCLKNALTKEPFTYRQYLVRKDKTKWYTADNVYLFNEKDLHECKSLNIALLSLQLIKQYETNHDSSVSYMTYYTRYYMYDMDANDSANLPFNPVEPQVTLGFRPTEFYNSVATESDCSLSTFMSRMHYSYLNGGFKARPYDMLKPDYSVKAAANQEGKLSYKQQWDRLQKEQKYSQTVKYYDSTNKDKSDDVYAEDVSNNVYNE